MKATQEAELFKPVTLTLETQHEVDALYAIFNYGPLTDSVNLPPETYQCLKPFKSDSQADLFQKIATKITLRK